MTSVPPSGLTQTGLVNSSCLDFLLIETVPMVQRLVQELNISSLDEKFFRIEHYGYIVGRGMTEIQTRERARFTDLLDMMKYVCKELWPLIFKKQVDNLKTNHRGTFVLIDNNFKYCMRMSTSLSTEETAKLATPYLWFPVGIIRGALAALGVNARVDFECTQLPQVSFNIVT